MNQKNGVNALPPLRGIRIGRGRSSKVTPRAGGATMWASPQRLADEPIWHAAHAAGGRGEERFVCRGPHHIRRQQLNVAPEAWPPWHPSVG
jgi:hypothetical protein